MIKPNRVVVTGMGIVSPIGNNVNEVKDSLINKKSVKVPPTSTPRRYDIKNNSF